jgi:tetratricopeptide (TPR) repeat protein
MLNLFIKGIIKCILQRIPPCIPLLLFFPPAFADSTAAYTRIDDPCDSKESWILGQRLSKVSRQLIDSVDHNSDGAAVSLSNGYKQLLASRSPEAKMVAEYIIYRAYFDLGLIHIAYRGFSGMVSENAALETSGLRLAALGCLNSIHHTYVSMRLPPNLLNSFRNVNISSLWPDQRKQLWNYATSIALRKFSELGANADISLEIKILERSGPYYLLVEANRAALQDNASSAIYYSNLFLSSKIPDTLLAQKNAIYLNLARIYYVQKNLDQAIQNFRQVKHDSNLLTQALVGMSWSFLVKSQMSDAVGTSFNLMAGDLKNTFNPEAPVIFGIAAIENCHYSEVRQSIQTFKKLYNPGYQWLYNWYRNGGRTKSGKSLYTLLTEAISTRKANEVPFRIVSEWARSAVFISWQQEMNLLFDEKKIAAQSINLIHQKDEIPSRYKAAISTIIRSFQNEIPALQTGLINGINHELNFLSRYMIAQWVRSYDNLQLLEVELYDSAATSMLNKKGSPTGTGAQKPKQTERDQEGLPVLDWGSYPVNNNDEKTETWQDEVGFMKADFNNLCPNK